MVQCFHYLTSFFKSKSLLKVSGAPVGPVRSWLLRDSARLRGPDRGERTSGVSNKSIKDHELKVNFFLGREINAFEVLSPEYSRLIWQGPTLSLME